MMSLPIPGYPGYEATDDGNIVSFWVRGTGSHLGETPRLLKPSVWGKNYLHVNLRKSKGVYKGESVHRLVCMAYNGLPEGDQTCSHLDGNAQNNTPGNLCWESLGANHARKLSHGTSGSGSTNTRAKFTNEDIKAIRLKLGQGLKHSEIAKQYGVARTTITKIKSGVRYKYD